MVRWAADVAAGVRGAGPGRDPPASRAPLGETIDGAFVIVGDLPGAEVVAEGVDPRIPVLLDGLSLDGEPPKASRVFVYRRNVERMGLSGSEAELIAQAITEEIRHAFPTLREASASSSRRRGASSSRRRRAPIELAPSRPHGGREASPR